MFTIFLFDDALLLHQKIGDYVAVMLNASPFYYLAVQSRYFELGVLAIAGFFLLALLAWASHRSDPIFRKVSTDLLLFIAALVFFGLVVDIAEWLRLGRTIVFVLGFVEDGGELAVYSLIVWYVYLLAIRHGKPDVFIYDLLFRNKR